MQHDRCTVPSRRVRSTWFKVQTATAVARNHYSRNPHWFCSRTNEQVPRYVCTVLYNTPVNRSGWLQLCPRYSLLYEYLYHANRLNATPQFGLKGVT